MEKLYLNETDIELLFNDLATKITATGKKKFFVYAIPRGGIPVAYRLLMYFPEMEITDHPIDAHFFIDDIVDTGATRARYLDKYPSKSFFALIPKERNLKHIWYVFPWEQREGGEDESATDIPLRMLEYIGEDPERDGLKDTPQRMLKAYDYLFSGYKMDATEILKRKFKNEEKYDEMVVLKDIEFYSMCEHHMLPFFGKIHLAYIPEKDGYVVGISKLARLVECFSRRLQIQERLTSQLAGAIEKELKAQGVAVFVEAQHLCMLSRGVQKQNSVMVTSDLRGVLRKEGARIEFLLLSKK